MSLAELYAEKYGKTEEAEKVAEPTTETPAAEETTQAETSGEVEGMTKEAADAALEKAVEALSEEDAEKVAQVVSVFEEEHLEFDHDFFKLAAAAEVVDQYAEYEESEKQASAEVEAAGRLMARALADELAKIGAENEAAPATEEKVVEEPKTLTEKLAKAVQE
jgi:hypothetical protein